MTAGTKPDSQRGAQSALSSPLSVALAVVDAMLRAFYHPSAKIHDRKTGYAVTAIKAGVSLRAYDNRPMRRPLSDLAEEDRGAPLASLQNPNRATPRGRWTS